MSAGTALVAVESKWREERLERNAVTPSPLLPAPPDLSSRESFAPGLVRTAITPTAEFYGMSKNTVDPAIDPQSWRLRITIDGSPVREWSYGQLLALPRTERYVSLRCISNTLKSNLMGCAHWSGVSLQSLVDTGRIPSNIRELAVIGADGHDDSLAMDYALSEGPFFALGMNGMSLNRTHGFPIRLLAPRYYGLKSVKWISELRFVTQPYFGTWPKLGYTKEPLVHTCCYIDKIRRAGPSIEAGGIAMAGDRGVKQVQVRIDNQEWVDASLEPPLSAQTWVRWRVRVTLPERWNQDSHIEARAKDGQDRWQPTVETPLFPNGVQGPTLRRLAL
jgi:DMSO/TMAO reductase YedYZ molybdopterin-dependent catalytic subunit